MTASGLTARLPEPPAGTALTPELAELLGLLAADGYVPDHGTIQFTNNGPELRAHVAALWRRLFLGDAREAESPSGWNPEKVVGQLYLTGGRPASEWLRSMLYRKDGTKRVPALVLNAPPELQARFLDGYYKGDGLKRGNGQAVKTNSAVLAQGLYWLYACQGRRASVYVEHRAGRDYYQLNLPSADTPGRKGQHLRKPADEVRRVVEVDAGGDWALEVVTGAEAAWAGVGAVAL